VSILLVDPPEDLGRAAVTQLLTQGDEVRVLATGPEPWRSMGAHVAVGEAEEDLIERAGQNARSLVLFWPTPEVLHAAEQGAAAARIDRLILVGDRSMPVPNSPGRVVLRVPGRWSLRKPTNEAIAEAIDWADDWAGETPLEKDLGKSGG
jgi:NAD(P)-dependent dehydrogenase (short-subunit alcohol dehydrogenase family)